MTETKRKVVEAEHRDIGKFVIRIDQETMKEIGIRTGDIVRIKGEKITGAIAWPSYQEETVKNIIKMDGRIRRNAGASLGEDVFVSKADIEPAKAVILIPTTSPVKPEPRFEEFVKRKLLNCPVSNGDTVFIPILGRAIPFKIKSIMPNNSVTTIQQSTKLTIDEKVDTSVDKSVSNITYENIGGLSEAIQRIREMVELPMKHPEIFQRLGIDPPSGLILHGPPGTGKTLLAKAVANESEANFVHINGPEIMSKFYGESEQKLRNIFKDAEENEPSIIFIDELDAIAPKREEVTGEVERRVVSQLLTAMDGLETRGRVIVIAATNRINAVDPALRRPGRFDREIEVGVPDEDGRKEVLMIHTMGMPLVDKESTLSDDIVDLDYIAKITHGFVGADINALCKEAAIKALRRYLPDINLREDKISKQTLESMIVTGTDFLDAMKEVTPSAIREVFLEIPNVNWDDVGGLDDVKQELIEVVEWPINEPEIFEEVGITPPKGVLLNGPPGCGKTLLARAVATESRANFISIKGPALMSKWVGESERAVREVFRKARMAAPTIIFFDEIDAIAPRRGMDNNQATERVISQLLTEMDGLDSAKGVIVIAATNRPDLIDPALLRTGRFDRFVFVDAPNEKSRKEIFNIYLKSMPLDDDVDVDTLVSMSESFVGGDIEALCREAGMFAVREFRGKKRKSSEKVKVKLEHFKESKKRIHASVTPDMIKRFKELNTKMMHVSISDTGPDMFV